MSNLVKNILLLLFFPIALIFKILMIPYFAIFSLADSIAKKDVWVINSKLYNLLF